MRLENFWLVSASHAPPSVALPHATSPAATGAPTATMPPPRWVKAVSAACVAAGSASNFVLCSSTASAFSSAAASGTGSVVTTAPAFCKAAE